MGMSHNPVPVEGYAPIATMEQRQDQQQEQQQYQQFLQQQQQMTNINQSQQIQFASNQQTLIDGSTVYLVQTPGTATAQLIQEDTIKQPIFVVTDIQSNTIDNNCTYIQVPNGNIIQMPSVAVPEVTDATIATAAAPATINLIQVPTINVQQVQQSAFIVANTNNSNNLILCLPPEGLTLQTDLTTNGTTLTANQLTIADIQISDEEDSQTKFEKAKNWHLDAEITNRALIALSANKKLKQPTHVRLQRLNLNSINKE